MTETLTNLKLRITELEAFARKVVQSAEDYSEFVTTGVEMGYDAAVSAALEKLLELGIKGVLPDGRVGSIMTEIRDAIVASKERVCGENQAMSGLGLPAPD